MHIAYVHDVTEIDVSMCLLVLYAEISSGGRVINLVWRDWPGRFFCFYVITHLCAVFRWASGSRGPGVPPHGGPGRVGDGEGGVAPGHPRTGEQDRAHQVRPMLHSSPSMCLELRIELYAVSSKLNVFSYILKFLCLRTVCVVTCSAVVPCLRGACCLRRSSFGGRI